MTVDDQTRAVSVAARKVKSKAGEILRLADGVLFAVDGIVLTVGQKQQILAKYQIKKCELEQLVSELP